MQCLKRAIEPSPQTFSPSLEPKELQRPADRRREYISVEAKSRRERRFLSQEGYIIEQVAGTLDRPLTHYLRFQRWSIRRGARCLGPE